jgi:hypothetical protein
VGGFAASAAWSRDARDGGWVSGPVAAKGVRAVAAVADEPTAALGGNQPIQLALAALLDGIGLRRAG